ncbi:hypothetical protein CmeUKMEL1_06905 [Cryptosporidium meleagridis]|uniref:Integral membrane protein n=1 Tax=Cryptosporidium meleagridis TaxID=93969 RepID=A0A2P4Z050_9CRYT|nr:hypothetical protein CmeUKMEL1_06905 [Cryptosporidium meleagridis]
MKNKIFLSALILVYLSTSAESASNNSPGNAEGALESNIGISTQNENKGAHSQATTSLETELSNTAAVFQSEVIQLIVRKKPLGISESLANFIAKFLVQNAVLLVILEFEVRSLCLNSIYLSKFWSNLNNISSSEHTLVKGMVNFWDDESDADPNSIVELMIGSSKIYKRVILKDYRTTKVSRHKLMLNHLNIFKCSNLKNAFALILLIFEGSNEDIFSVLLLFLLICSARFVEGNSFKEKFEYVIRNENGSGSLISIIGGRRIESRIKKFHEAMTSSRISLSRVDQVLFPLETSRISIEEFGSRFCISLLELALLDTLEFSSKYLLFFFTSRMTQASEVLLSLDLYNIITKKNTDPKITLALFLYDDNVFSEAKKKTLTFHNLDLSNLKNNLHECFKLKEENSMLKEIKIETDYQRKTRKKRDVM